MRIKVIKAKKDLQLNQKIRVCAYARVSTDTNEQEGSLENQIAYYQNLIQSNPQYELVDVFYDQGISGYKEKRPGFQEMMQQARAGKIDLILTKSISRFARNTVTVLKFVRELKSMGVGIFFEIQNIHTLSSEGEVMLTILAAFAQAESESASETAKMTFQRKFKNGITIVRAEDGLGYQTDAYGDIVVNKQVAKVVKEIFKLTLQGIRPTRIATYLNKKNVTTIKGKEWDARGVFRIIENEIYKGDIKLQKTYTDLNRKRHRNRGERDSWYIEDNHPAIISREDWDRVQELLEERRNETLEPIPERSSFSKNTYPLSGMLYCSKCNAKLIHKTSSNKGNQAYWACSTNIKKTKAACSGIWLSEKIADEWNITEPVIVIEGEDEYGQKYYTYTSKSKWERKQKRERAKKDSSSSLL